MLKDMVQVQENFSPNTLHNKVFPANLLTNVTYLESPNPCANGAATTQIRCNPGSTMGTTCGSHQFCHVGQAVTTTVCCNKPRKILILKSGEDVKEAIVIR